jgi:hypothetical protein
MADSAEGPKESNVTYATKEEADALIGLLTWIGFSLVAWQKVEEAHYQLFAKLLSVPKPEICSAIYFQLSSFSSRCDMIDKITQIAIEDEKLKQD